MYVKNNQISGRQAMRLMTFDLLGYSALLVPGALSAISGRDGIFALFIGVAAGFLYLRLLKCMMDGMQQSYGGYITELCGAVVGNVLKAGYLLYFLLLAGRVAAVFAELVVKELLEKEFQLILAVILALAYYGVSGGIEGRARIYEILFWILLFPLFLMMAFAFPTVDTDYWLPVFSESIGNILKGGYLVFLCIPALCMVPFLAEYVSEKKRVYRCAKKALLLTGGILAVLYLILLGMFGEGSLSTLDYPAVTMMSRIQITGGFLKRTDAFMFGIWFFTLYALLNGLLFFAGKLWEMKKKTARWWLLAEIAVTYALAEGFYHSEALKGYYDRFLWWIGTPFVVLVPLILCVMQKMESKGEK